MLPDFPYHPDPLATGSVKASAERCECCSEARGFVYVGPFYAVDEIVAICPWCIAGGDAAAKFDGSFVDDANFAGEGLGEEIVRQVCLRTPSYAGWQQEQWLSHCNDACAFHGNATSEDLDGASEATRGAWKSAYGLTDRDWTRAIAGYPNNDSGFYKFVCRHCRVVLLAWDMS